MTRQLNPLPLALAWVLAAPFVAAQAQGSVTIYGGVDANLTHVQVKGSGSQNTMLGGGQYGSRLGFKGDEDLGGGYKVEYVLESEFNSGTGKFTPTNPDNTYDGSNRGGTGGLVFSRKLTLGLHTPIGEFRAGRDYTTAFVPATYFDPFFSAGVAQATNYQPFYKNVDLSLVKAPNFVLAPGTLVRASSMLAYYIPSRWVPGLWAYAQHSFHSDDKPPRYNGLAVGYYKGPWLMAAGWNQTKNPLPGTDTFLTTDTASKDNTFTAISAGLSYRFSNQLTLMGFHHSQRFDAYGEKYSPVTFGLTERNRKVDDTLVGISWPMGPHTWKASYLKRNDRGLENADSRQIGLGYSYNFSKRTAFYANFVDIANKNNAVFNFYGAPSVPTYGGGARALQAGLSTTF